MVQLKGLLTIEVDGWTGARTCPKCGGQNRIVRGFVLQDGQRHATYFAELPERGAAHRNPRVCLVVGVPDENADIASVRRFAILEAWPRKRSNLEESSRRTFEKWGKQEQMGGPWVRLKVLDAPDAQSASGNMLPGDVMNRAEVLADPRKSGFFIAAEIAARYDPRVRGYLAESRALIRGR